MRQPLLPALCAIDGGEAQRGVGVAAEVGQIDIHQLSEQGIGRLAVPRGECPSGLDSSTER
jgi:hypothetical protein